MPDFGRSSAVAVIGLSAWLFGCASLAAEPQGLAGAGGMSPGASGTASIAGSASTAGDQASENGLMIAGSWALFGFEDPVGVELRQSGSSLNGIGCGVGTPHSPGSTSCAADLSGTITGNQVKFAFSSV